MSGLKCRSLQPEPYHPIETKSFADDDDQGHFKQQLLSTKKLCHHDALDHASFGICISKEHVSRLFVGT